MISFKYKLTLLILIIVLLLLGGTFYRVQANLEEKFTLTIEADLKKSQFIVAELMRQRLNKLEAAATILQGNTLLRDILTDRGIDRLTAKDILQEEILPDFPELSLLLLADSNGKVLATTGLGKQDNDFILQHRIYQRLMNGKRGLGYLFQHDVSVQLIGIPVFLREELIGMMIIGSPLTQAVVDRVKAMSGADLALFRDEQIFLASDWQSGTKKRLKREQITALINPKQLSAVIKKEDSPALGIINDERWLYAHVHNRQGFLPDYILAKSLDAQLALVDDIRHDTLIIAGIALFIGSILAFLFSLGVSRPIIALKRATDAVEGEDFSYRTQIKSRDEFEQLGSSFNLMIEGLQERESMRGLMNRLMSKQVVDELLYGEIKTSGEPREVSCLLFELIHFDQFSAPFTPEATLGYLNDCFTRAGFCIDAHQGVINHYYNHTFLALFGAPVAQKNHAQHAFQAALDMHEAISIFNHEMAENRSFTPLQVHIAISSGMVIAGNIGAENRQSYNIAGQPLAALKPLSQQLKQHHVAIALDQKTHLALSTKQHALLQQHNEDVWLLKNEQDLL